jgi:hypothetical protein
MLGLAESITAGFVGLKGGLPFLMVALTVMTMALMNFMMRLYASPKTSLSAYSAFDHFDAFFAGKQPHDLLWADALGGLKT